MKISERSKHFSIGDHAVLDDLGEALVQLAGRKFLQDVRVGHDQRWMMHGAQQVFSRSRVDAGLSADRAVNHGQEGGGDLDMGNAAIINGSHKSGNVADDPPAQTDDKGRAIQPRCDHAIADSADLLETFRVLARGNCNEDRRETGCLEIMTKIIAEKVHDVFIGNNRAGALAQSLRDGRARLLE